MQSKTFDLKKALLSTKDTKKHEKSKHYRKTDIHQTGHIMMLYILLI